MPIDPSTIPLGPLAGVELLVRTSGGRFHSDPDCETVAEDTWRLEVVTFPTVGDWTDVAPLLTRLCDSCGNLPADVDSYREAVEWLVVLTAILDSPSRPVWLDEVAQSIADSGELLTPPGQADWPPELAMHAAAIAVTLL